MYNLITYITEEAIPLEEKKEERNYKYLPQVKNQIVVFALKDAKKKDWNKLKLQL